MNHCLDDERLQMTSGIIMKINLMLHCRRLNFYIMRSNLSPIYHRINHNDYQLAIGRMTDAVSNSEFCRLE